MAKGAGKILKNVGLNIATGGLYSVGKAVKKTIETGNPKYLLSQGLDIGAAALVNQVAMDIGGPKAGMAVNLAGLAGGGLGASGAFAGLPGFSAGGVAPLAATASPAIGTAAAGSTEIGAALGSGVAPAAIASPAIGTAAAGSTEIGAALAAPTATGGLAAGAAPAIGTAAAGSTEIGAALGSPVVTSELAGAAPALNATPTAGWFASLSPGAQTALVTGGFAAAQMGTGAMQGIFAGVSAQKKLELERLINSQRQNQVQYLNKNNSYTPLLTFKQPGLANTVGAPNANP